MKIQETIAKAASDLARSFVLGMVVTAISAIAMGGQDPTPTDTKSTGNK